MLQQIWAQDDKSVAQVVLCWLSQCGIVSLAKSVHLERMQENFAVAELALTDADMAKIAALDAGGSLFFNHESLDTVDFMHSLVTARRK